MASSKLVGAIGRGLISGAVGTVAMTLSEQLEMAVTGRDASQVPGKVGAHSAMRRFHPKLHQCRLT